MNNYLNVETLLDTETQKLMQLEIVSKQGVNQKLECKVSKVFFAGGLKWLIQTHDGVNSEIPAWIGLLDNFRSRYLFTQADLKIPVFSFVSEYFSGPWIHSWIRLDRLQWRDIKLITCIAPIRSSQVHWKTKQLLWNSTNGAIKEKK